MKRKLLTTTLAVLAVVLLSFGVSACVKNAHHYVKNVVEPGCEQGYTEYVCSSCGESYREDYVDAHHSVSKVEEVLPTCSKDGHTAYYLCLNCGKMFSDENGKNEIIDKNSVVTTLPHNLNYVEAKSATCAADGNKAYYECLNCGKWFSDEKAENEITDKSSVIIPATAEVYMVKGQPATCTEVGNITYYVCLDCGKWFSDEKGENEITDKSSVIIPIDKDAHNFGEWTTVTAATCTEAGEEKRICKNDSTHVETREIKALGHSYDEGVVTTAPTCEATGVKTYTCTKCDGTKTETIAALGHDKVQHEAKVATCTEKGWNAYETCTRCDYTTYEEIAPLGHDKVQHEAKAATCTEKGWNAYETCKRCDYTTYAEIAPLGHKEGTAVEENRIEATCLDDGSYDLVIYCTVCKAELSRETKTILAKGHAYGEWTTVKEATCTEKGQQQRICANDSKHVETREIAALGHDTVNHEAKAASCTEIGWNAYETCTRCDYTTYAEIAALGHDTVNHEAKAATCTEKGWNAYETCTRCDYTTYEEIAATGHKYEATVTAPTCTEKGYTTHTCTTCGDSYVDTYVDATGHTEVVDKAVEPTCTETGLTEGKHCSVCNTVLVKQEVVDAKGHTEVIDAAVEPTCTETGLTEGKHCSVCNTVLVKQEVVEAKGHTEEVIPAKAATCTETGLTEGKKCSVCGETILAQETIPALGHKEETVAGKAATCTETGLTEGKKCSVCGETILAQETIPALGHTEEVVPGKAATCTETGLTEGKKCSVCNTITVEQTVIEALGHDYVENVCSRCNDEISETEILNALFALNDGETLPGTYKLTGTITEIVTPWSSTYNNITVNIKVGEQIVQCFRLTSSETTNAQYLKVGNVITVTGTLKNYNGTQEFDASCILQGCEVSVTEVQISNGTTTLETSTYQLGSTVTFTVTPTDGYVVKSVSVNGAELTADESGKYTFTITEDSVVVITIEQIKKQRVTFNATNATVTVDGVEVTSLELNSGSTLKFTVVPNEGYSVDFVKTTIAGTTELLFADSNGDFSIEVQDDISIQAVASQEINELTYTISIADITKKLGVTVPASGSGYNITELDIGGTDNEHGTTVSGIKVTITDGSTPSRLWKSGTQWRVYTGGELSVSVPSCYIVKSINLSGWSTFGVVNNSVTQTVTTSTTIESITITYRVACLHETTEEFGSQPATCTEKGYSAGTRCADCGMVVSQPTEISALGHDVQFTHVDGTATHSGICTRCSETITEDCLDSDNNNNCDVCGTLMVQTYTINVQYVVGEGAATTQCPDGVTLTWTDNNLQPAEITNLIAGSVRFLKVETGINYTLVSITGGVETENGTQFTVNSDITVTITLEEVTFVEKTLTFDNTAKRTEFSTTKQVWKENGITFTNAKASSTTNVANYSKPIRCYKNSTIKVEYPSMVKIVFTCNTSSYATALKNSIGTEATENGKMVTVAFKQETDSFDISALSAQVQLDSITVYTLPAAPHDHTFGSWSITTAPTDTLEGEATRVCTVENCGATETKALPVLNDTSVWTHNHTNATCTTEGSDVYTSDYGTVTVTLPATGVHNDGNNDGKCDECSNPMGETPQPAEPITVTQSTFTATSGKLDNNVSYTTAKGGGTSAPALNSGKIRLYQNSAGTGGGTITITVPEGMSIQSIEIGSSMKTFIAYTVGTDTAKSEKQSLSANGKATLTFSGNVTSVTIHCMGTDKNSRLYVNYLSVTYAPVQ